MTDRTDDTQDAPMADKEFHELLPWYVNGTLEPEARARIEAYVAENEDAAAELRAEQRLAGAIQALDVDESATERSWEKLQAQIQQESTVTPLPAPVRRARRTGSRRLAYASGAVGMLIAASFAVLVVGPAIMPSSTEDPGGFRTLTTPDASVAETVVRIRVAEGVTAEEVSDLAATHGFSVDADPSESGVYTLIPTTMDALDARIAALGEHPQVLFATLRGEP